MQQLVLWGRLWLLPAECRQVLYRSNADQDERSCHSEKEQHHQGVRKEPQHAPNLDGACIKIA
jgi:hypothetical protein